MGATSGRTRAVVFDYGNTLIQFTLEQIEFIDGALEAFLRQRFGSLDGDQLRAIRKQDRLRPFARESQLRENDMVEMTSGMLQELYGRRFEAEDIAAVNELRLRVFVESISKPAYLDRVLEELQGSYRLAVLSNYPCGPSIRTSLERVGIHHLFESIVVSGEVGYVKPHPSVFERTLEELGTQPQETVYVGDNWLADVQGARRMGMPVVHTRQWEPPDHHPPDPDDHAPNGTIQHLKELAGVLAQL